MLITILTGGLWLVSWIALYIGKIRRPWRCEHCSWHQPEFREKPGTESPNIARARYRRRSEQIGTPSQP